MDVLQQWFAMQYRVLNEATRSLLLFLFLLLSHSYGMEAETKRARAHGQYRRPHTRLSFTLRRHMLAALPIWGVPGVLVLDRFLCWRVFKNGLATRRSCFSGKLRRYTARKPPHLAYRPRWFNCSAMESPSANAFWIYGSPTIILFPGPLSRRLFSSPLLCAAIAGVCNPHRCGCRFHDGIPG